MNQIKSFIIMAVSNKELLRSIHFKGYIVILLFILNVSLISVPNFVGKMESIEVIDQLVGIEEAMIELYDDELDCHITEQAEMRCSVTEEKTYGDYDLLLQDELDVSNITSSTIVFANDTAAIIYVDEYDMAYTISGNYGGLTGVDLSTIKTNNTSGLSQDIYYEDATDFILTAIYYSTLTAQFQLIYLSQAMQLLIYLMVISIVFLLMNFKADTKKLSFYNANKIIVTAMTGPAFLVALVGLFIPSWASIMFFIIFALRIMFVYYRMNFSTETFVD